MDRQTTLQRIIYTGMAATVVLVCSCVGLAIAVINDCDTAEMVLGWLMIVSIAVMAAAIIAALIGRKWWLAIAGVAAIAVCMAVCMFIGILIGAGQHHPPFAEQEMAETIDATDVIPTWGARFLHDGDNNRILDNDLPDNSWWTDGTHYYKATKTGINFHFIGMTLHEGGLITDMQLNGGILRVTMPKEGYNTFAEVGDIVRRHEITLADNQKKVELLVAYSADDDTTPVAALQRFDGNELKFELDGIHALLEGTYTDDKGTEWTFLPDGTMKLSATSQPRKYDVELCYHMPTNVVRLPNGERVAIELSADNTLNVLAASYDADEEEWEEAEPRKVRYTLKKKDAEEWSSDLAFWYTQRLLTRPMTQLMEETSDDRYDEYGFFERSTHPLGMLNTLLLYQWADEED